MSKSLEEKILEKYFRLEGELTGGDRDAFYFELEDEPYHVKIKLKGNTVELHESYTRGYYEHTNTQTLSEEDIHKLRVSEYEWE